VLPDFSIIGDPLEKLGVITWRPIAGDDTQVKLVIQRVRSLRPTRAVRDLHQIFIERARVYPGQRIQTAATEACPPQPL
jgi:hypothetical protein